MATRVFAEHPEPLLTLVFHSQAINGMKPYQEKFESGRLGATTGIM